MNARGNLDWSMSGDDFNESLMDMASSGVNTFINSGLNGYGKGPSLGSYLLTKGVDMAKYGMMQSGWLGNSLRDKYAGASTFDLAGGMDISFDFGGKDGAYAASFGLHFGNGGMQLHDGPGELSLSAINSGLLQMGSAIGTAASSIGSAVAGLWENIFNQESAPLPPDSMPKGNYEVASAVLNKREEELQGSGIEPERDDLMHLGQEFPLTEEEKNKKLIRDAEYSAGFQMKDVMGEDFDINNIPASMVTSYNKIKMAAMDVFNGDATPEEEKIFWDAVAQAKAQKKDIDNTVNNHPNQQTPNEQNANAPVNTPEAANGSSAIQQAMRNAVKAMMGGGNKTQDVITAEKELAECIKAGRPMCSAALIVQLDKQNFHEVPYRNANGIYTALEKDPNWISYPVTEEGAHEKAQKAAENGDIVIAAYYNKDGMGHVAIVAASGYDTKGNIAKM